MAASHDASGFRHLVDDRASEGIFKVHRDAYVDEAVFDAEIEKVFERSWMFVGLESQVRNNFDYMTTNIGRQPIVIMRDGDGAVRAFFNSCRHRGALVFLRNKGNQKVHQCRYHGWVYDSAGKNVFLPGEASGQYPDSFKEDDHDLVPLPRFEVYRGLMFASASGDVPSLQDHLGDARWFLDLVLDQAPEGLEVLPGSITYTFNANWKMQLENGVDYYHFSSTHSSYVDVIRQRNALNPPPGVERWVPDETLDQGTFSFDRGHAVMWGNRNSLKVIRPLLHDRQKFERISDRVGPIRAKWMQMNRNLTVFPNMQLIDVHSLQLRVWNPISVDQTETRSWCLAPIGEAPEARKARIRQYEDFFNPSGMATSDDNTMFELSQGGMRADAAGWTQGHLRGLGAKGLVQSEPEELGKGLGIQATDSKKGDMTFGGETSLHAGYREWFRLINKKTET